jgi:chromosome segregation ATPase
MERNMHTVEIGKLETKIAELESTVTERSKAGLVLEQTVSKRIPDLEGQIEELDNIVVARDHELAERARSFNNQGEVLTLAQTMIRRQEQEIERLRSSLESGVGSQLKHFGKAVDVDEKYTELARQKGKVEAELSHLRQDMAQLKEVEVADAAQLRRELQHLAGHMLSGTAPAKPAKPSGKPAADEKAQDSQTPPAEHVNKSEPKSKRPTSERGTKQTAKPRKSLSDRLAGLTSSKRKTDSKQKADA